MPELPEVETVRRGLVDILEGARIVKAFAYRPDLRFPLPVQFSERLTGQTITALSRRAKYLLADLSDGSVLAMHLGMSGSLRIEAETGSVMPGVFHHPRFEARLHDHVRLEVETRAGAAAAVVFNDPRRFGSMTLLKRSEVGDHPLFRDLGIEPTGNALSGQTLAPFFAGRSAPLKAVLLDQRVIAGLGNIYVCEALWRARLSPRRAAGTLVRKSGQPTARLDGLAERIRETIADAIEAGGSSLRDYRKADGTLGLFQHRFAAYDREGQSCRHEDCHGLIRRIVQSGRSTFFCPVCQR